MRRLRQAGIAWSRPDGTRCFVSLRPELEQRLPGLFQAVLNAADRETASAGGQSPAEG